MTRSQVDGGAGSRPLRVALFGCGKMGLHHLRAISTTNTAKVVGIADPALDREAISGLVDSDIYVTGDPADLLAHVRPDVVHIVTPPATHAALARMAIAAGCHVYVEKPFASTREEAESVLGFAAERSVRVCPGHQCLFDPPAAKVLDALPRIGALVHVESYFSFRMVRRTISPVDQVNDILPHAVYPVVEQLRARSGLADEPISVVGLNVQPKGEVYALVRLGACTGVIIVTLNGRPVEQYQHLVGTNGWLRADYVSGAFAEVAGPGTGAGMLLTPYRRAFQAIAGATRGFATRILRRQSSYAGLQRLIARFYESILDGADAPVSAQSILETVSICEQIGAALEQAERREEAAARDRLERSPAPPCLGGPRVVVTGGTGQLGRRVAQELRSAGFSVRVVARRTPSYATRLAGVEYAAADLTRPIDEAVFRGAGFVVHCAAETAGGKAEHEKNSIAATRHVVEAAGRAYAKVVHISSLAVLKPGGRRHRELDEDSPVDLGNLERGPYVWGKAESEALAQRLGRELNVPLVVIRPGPIVDSTAFQAPGRLGREVGPLFVAVGGRRQRLDVCDVGNAARVIRSYLEDFDAAPPIVNLVDDPAPSREDLARRLRAARPDLRVVWLPGLVLRAMAGPLKWMQRLMLGTKKPVDICAAFASERYRTTLARSVIDRASSDADVDPLGRSRHVA